MKKITINNYDIFSNIDIDIDVNKPPKLNRTLEDFGGDQGMFDLYLKIEKTFNDYYKRMDSNAQFKSSIDSLMETIGPHESKELELMISGEKPAAIVGLKKLVNFKPYVDKKQIIKVSFRHFCFKK